MVKEDIDGQIDSLMDELGQATLDSATGIKDWDGFSKFLSKLETLATYHDPDSCDVFDIIKQRPICYYIANEQLDDRQQAVANAWQIIPRLHKLIESGIFPSKTNYNILCDWLQQVVFLFEINSADKTAEPISIELLDQVLTISSKLIGFCVDRLRFQKIHIIELAKLNSYNFEKICDISKLGISRENSFETHLKALELMKQMAILMQEPQFVATFAPERFETMSNELWSIFHQEPRSIMISFFGYTYRRSKNGLEDHSALKSTILALIELLPANDKALEFFHEKLATVSLPEINAADLAMLDATLKGRKYQDMDKVSWPILDIHMSRTEPIIREACLDIALGLFRRNAEFTAALKAMFEHLDLIIESLVNDQADEHRNTRTKIFKLLTSLPRCNEGSRIRIERALGRALHAVPNQDLNSSFIDLVVKECVWGYPTMATNPFENFSIERFKSIYQSDIEPKDRIVPLRSLARLFLICKFDMNESRFERPLFDILIAGRNGVAPIGCDNGMFSLLKKTMPLVYSGDVVSLSALVPIATRIYDHEDTSKLQDCVLEYLVKNKTFETDVEANNALVKLANQK